MISSMFIFYLIWEENLRLFLKNIHKSYEKKLQFFSIFIPLTFIVVEKQVTNFSAILITELRLGENILSDPGAEFGQIRYRTRSHDASHAHCNHCSI